LAADAGPTRSLVSAERGLLYFPGAGANLAAGVRAAFAQPERLAAMGAAGVTFAAERGWDRIFDDLIAERLPAIAGTAARRASPPSTSAPTRSGRSWPTCGPTGASAWPTS
ncbi:MAG: hypothetical protein KGL38_08505, partial [Gemmatimonadota bacterium]|nr:hypothetical protein [Gemmatimonadota bacterium]